MNAQGIAASVRRKEDVRLLATTNVWRPGRHRHSDRAGLPNLALDQRRADAGGVEANAALANANSLSWEQYLAWHYNHGAKLVGINIGASDQSLMSKLINGAFGDEAMAAYRKFLRGEKLIER